ncbi:MAG: hypothetical protein KDK07_22595 [Bauldia sp.]|nr:hypothetical protein [Bauldia sp.]
MRSETFTRFCKASVVAVAGIVLGVGPSFSAGTSIAVSGDSKPSECGAANSAGYSIEMSGSLKGCWSAFVGHFNCQEMNGFSLYTEIGREAFDGTLDGEAVTFDTQYTFSGIFPSGSCPEPSAEKEIAGGCIHYISGDGLVGVMRFYDVMHGEGAPHFFYEGTLSKS